MEAMNAVLKFRVLRPDASCVFVFRLISMGLFLILLTYPRNRHSPCLFYSVPMLWFESPTVVGTYAEVWFLKKLTIFGLQPFPHLESVRLLFGELSYGLKSLTVSAKMKLLSWNSSVTSRCLTQTVGSNQSKLTDATLMTVTECGRAESWDLNLKVHLMAPTHDFIHHDAAVWVACNDAMGTMFNRVLPSTRTSSNDDITSSTSAERETSYSKYPRIHSSSHLLWTASSEAIHSIHISPLRK